MDLEKLTTEVKPLGPGARRFEVKPSEMYPAAIADLRATLESGRAVSGALAMYKGKAQSVDVEAWGLALLPRGDVTSSVAIRARAVALELARLWFTESLHQSIDHAPMELRILKDGDWRL